MCRAFVQKVRRPEVSKRVASSSPLPSPPIQYGGRRRRRRRGEDRLHSHPRPSSLYRLYATLLKRPGLFECQPHTRLCPSFSRLTLGSSSRHKVFSILSQSRPLDDFASLSLSLSLCLFSLSFYLSFSFSPLVTRKRIS